MYHILYEKDEHCYFHFSAQRTGKCVTFINLCARSGIAPSNICVIAPLSTLPNIRAEFRRWLGWRVAINPGVPTPEVLGDEDDPPFSEQTVTAVGVETLRNRAHWWGFKRRWALVLLDEAHRYANRGSQQTYGAFMLTQPHKRGTRWISGAQKVVIATGTPLPNGLPRELWTLLHMADPKRWSSYWHFLHEYAVVRYMPGSPTGVDEDSPFNQQRLAQLRAYVEERGRWRSWESVAVDLPRVISRLVSVDLLDVPEHARAYQQLEAEWRTTIEGSEVITPTALSRTMRLAQFAASPRILGIDLDGAKIEKLASFVNTPSHVGVKIVVFAWHRAMARAIARRLSGWGRPIYAVDGMTEALDRAEKVEEWRDDPGPAILVATIGALSEGISLDAASVLIMVEQSWVPKDNEQAAARILGPGMKGLAHVYTMLCKDTIEITRYYTLQRKKKAIAGFLGRSVEEVRTAAITEVIHAAR